ncbi:hypothetical protein CLV34_0077 [Luteimicrobium subarcticum]|uniref:Uncharacterized protein n=1 Tax=Luteimicrobium subarcticum TaxID=620910 RepID=A0A2M8WWB1_9MICO|nr:hypothetical protein CLV34_0077 [Luteimicrobium subarcticum]
MSAFSATRPDRRNRKYFPSGTLPAGQSAGKPLAEVPRSVACMLCGPGGMLDFRQEPRRHILLGVFLQPIERQVNPIVEFRSHCLGKDRAEGDEGHKEAVAQSDVPLTLPKFGDDCRTRTFEQREKACRTGAIDAPNRRIVATHVQFSSCQPEPQISAETYEPCPARPKVVNHGHHDDHNYSYWDSDVTKPVRRPVARPSRPGHGASPKLRLPSCRDRLLLHPAGPGHQASASASNHQACRRRSATLSATRRCSAPRDPDLP